MAKTVDFFVKSENNVHTIVIKNHDRKRDYFKSDDLTLVQERMVEIQQDLDKAGPRPKQVEILVGLYRFANDRGCIAVWKSRGAFSGVLKIKPEQDKWLLILARGRREIIIKRDSNGEVIKTKYLELLRLKVKQPDLFQTMWDYAMQKQKVELRDAQ